MTWGFLENTKSPLNRDKSGWSDFTFISNETCDIIFIPFINIVKIRKGITNLVSENSA